MSKVAAFVLAGARVADMGVLTLRRAKAALPFAGHFRIIDFAVSNLARSGIERVGVLSQYRPSSLMDHVGVGEPWGLIGRGREVRMLSPFQAEKTVDWYRGTADAVYQNLNFLRDEEMVLVLSGDHIYGLDYRPLIAAHQQSGAAVTMVFKRFSGVDCTRFGNALLDPWGRVTAYIEKPDRPVSDLGSLTIYLFQREALERSLAALFRTPPSRFHLYETVIPELIEAGAVQGYVMDDYWAYARTIDDYYAASMDLLVPASGLDLGRWETQTNAEQTGIGDKPPALVAKGAVVRNSWLSPGSQVAGTVIDSVLSPGVVVEAGAQVTASVLMHRTRVEAGAHLCRVVSDKHVTVGRESRVGHSGPAVPNRRFGALHCCGVTVIGRGAQVGAEVGIGANCQVAPDSVLAAGTVLPDGACHGLEGGMP